MGNHKVKMRLNRDIFSQDIVLYHYHVRNYKGYEARAKRWIEATKYMAEDTCKHNLNVINLYNSGKLREHYDSIYGEEMRKFLIEQGVVAIDKSVLNFLKWKEIV